MIQPNPNPHVFKNLGESLYQKTMAEMMNTELALIEAESKLLVLEQEFKASNGENGEQESAADAEFTALIEAELMKDPEVVGLSERSRKHETTWRTPRTKCDSPIIPLSLPSTRNFTN